MILMGMKFEEERDEWVSPDGKVIPFTRFEHELTEFQNEFCGLSISITRWPSNTSIEVIEVSGECGWDDEVRYLSELIHRIQKLPHKEFQERQDELIMRAKRVAQRIYANATGEN